jgi:ribosomal protein S18 acetylase RimI-like enzyme
MINRYYQLAQNVYEQISDLWTITGVGNPARGDSLDVVQRTLEHGGVILVAYAEDLSIGTAWLTHDFRRLYIHHMAVHPLWQNHGIGKSLMQEAIQIAHELGFQAKLEVHQDNPAANKLYANFGFEPLTGYTAMIKRDV